jgi:cytochrome P450
MVMAGVHTTRSLLTHLVHRLLFDPQMTKTLREDPTLIPNYVEESLRHDSPVQATSRRCTRDFALSDTQIAKGDWIEVGLGSANRDENAYEDPDVFRLDREDPRDHLGFGAGSHICPGAALARLEAQACVRVLLERTSALTPVAGVQYPPLPSSLSDLPIPARLTPA